MREILFRGKQVDGGEWISGDLRHWQNGKVGIHNDAMRCTLVVIPETVGQYTGLKDKNGRRIYEGDVVEAVLPPSLSQPSFVWPIMPAVFFGGVFGLLDQRGEVTPLKSFAPTITFEVKGNIHDNP